MQEHNHDQVHCGTERPVSPRLQELFQHGTEIEIHALGTLLGKIMPVLYPGMKYSEDGCEILDICDGYMVVSGDGTGVDGKENNCVAFEYKCPLENKQFTTDLYYTLPTRYVLQIASQMAVKDCDRYANICYTRESSTLLTGSSNPAFWNLV